MASQPSQPVPTSVPTTSARYQRACPNRPNLFVHPETLGRKGGLYDKGHRETVGTVGTVGALPLLTGFPRPNLVGTGRDRMGQP